MELSELQKIIKNSGGQCHALAYAEIILPKINKLENSGKYEPILKQFRTAKNEGDLRGRLLEINFANLFLDKNINLLCCEKQDKRAGDVDFCWEIDNQKIYMELKLLQQDQTTKESIKSQLDNTQTYAISRLDNTNDILRIQYDLIQKASLTKFSQTPQKNWINLIAIDVAELQLGGIDIYDCILATRGNTAFSGKESGQFYQRNEVVGIFEELQENQINIDQKNWINQIQKKLKGSPHPQSYIHGALFLFREPKESAALAYDLTSLLVWNENLISHNTDIEKISTSLYEVIPKRKC